MCNAAGVMANFVPELNIFELPCLFENREHFYVVLDSEIGESLRPAFEQKGFHFLGYFDCGVQHLMTVNEPVNSIDDLNEKEHEWYKANDENILEKLKNKEITITYPDKNPFKELSYELYKEWADKVGGMELIEKIINYNN